MFRMGSLFGTKNKMAPNQLLKGGFPLFTRFCFNLLSWLLETSPGFPTPLKAALQKRWNGPSTCRPFKPLYRRPPSGCSFSQIQSTVQTNRKSKDGGAPMGLDGRNLFRISGRSRNSSRPVLRRSVSIFLSALDRVEAGIASHNLRRASPSLTIISSALDALAWGESFGNCAKRRSIRPKNISVSKCPSFLKPARFRFRAPFESGGSADTLFASFLSISINSSRHVSEYC